MKSSKSLSGSPEQGKDRSRQLLPVLAIIGLLAIGSVVYWQLTQNGRQKNLQQETGTQEPEQPRVPIVAPPPEERIVYAYAGRVTSLDTGAKTITLQTTRGEKKVFYTADTAFLLTTQPSPEERQVREPDELASRTTEQQGSETDVTVDTTIIAQSNENIRGMEEFTAVKITIIK